MITEFDYFRMSVENQKIAKSVIGSSLMHLSNGYKDMQKCCPSLFEGFWPWENCSGASKMTKGEEISTPVSEPFRMLCEKSKNRQVGDRCQTYAPLQQVLEHAKLLCEFPLRLMTIVKLLVGEYNKQK